MKTKHIFFAIYLLSILAISSCKKDAKVEKDTFSSPKTLFVEYVSAYTTGFISKKSEITIKLAKPVVTAEAGKEIDVKIFSFDPALKGRAVWEDDRTIVFKPSAELTSGQRYKTIFLLDKLVEVPSDRSQLKFTFECMPGFFFTRSAGRRCPQWR